MTSVKPDNPLIGNGVTCVCQGRELGTNNGLDLKLIDFDGYWLQPYLVRSSVLSDTFSWADILHKSKTLRM